MYFNGFIYAIHIVAAKSILSHDQYIVMIETVLLYATGVPPDLPNDLAVCVFLFGALASQDASQRRYLTQRINGKKGGRPTTAPNRKEIMKVISDGLFPTIQAVAEHFGCSPGAIGYRVKGKEVRDIYKKNQKRRILQAVKDNEFQTISEVANYLHISYRQVQRYVTAKEIRQAYLSIPVTIE